MNGDLNNKNNKTFYYAYYIKASNSKGIMTNWDECQKIVYGKESNYKKFKTREEAEHWLANIDKLPEEQTIYPKKYPPGIYFDAGTGRGIGVEVRVTDESGNILLNRIVPEEHINEYGNYRIPFEDATNNYGELVGCYTALKIALKENVKKIYGDSQLIIEYWSKGFIKKSSKIPARTYDLVEKVKLLRSEFEQKGGKIEKIDGDENPADLGFHK